MLLSWLRAAPVALVCLAACSFDESGVGGNTMDAAVADGPIAPTPDGSTNTPDASVLPDGNPSRPDATVGAPDAQVGTPDAQMGTPDAACPGDVLPITPSNFGKCDVPAPITDANLSNGTWVVNTTMQTLQREGDPTVYTLNANVVTQSGGPEIVVWALNSLVVEATGVIQVRGNRPLAIVAFGDITLDGGLTANATFEQAGPGGSPSGTGTTLGFCNTGTGGAGITQNVGGENSGSGAGGGAYGDDAGGGARVAQAGGSSIAAAGGVTNGNVQIIPLRGGCGGGAGGNGGEAGGAGGGAIQVVSGGTLRVGITGRIVARGGGGGGSNGQATGGGGGGSGGAILLEAPTITIDGDIAANGGGGAEGTASGGMSWFGGDGENGSNGDSAAAGGDRGGFGGNGGDGGHRSGAAANGSEGQADSTPPAGGGGGGGSVGRIRLNATTVNTGVTTTITPQETRG